MFVVDPMKKADVEMHVVPNDEKPRSNKPAAKKSSRPQPKPEAQETQEK
jgi:hypothetical protein